MIELHDNHADQGVQVDVYWYAAVLAELEATSNSAPPPTQLELRQAKQSESAWRKKVQQLEREGFARPAKCVVLPPDFMTGSVPEARRPDPEPRERRGDSVPRRAATVKARRRAHRAHELRNDERAGAGPKSVSSGETEPSRPVYITAANCDRVLGLEWQWVLRRSVELRVPVLRPSPHKRLIRLDLFTAALEHNHTVEEPPQMQADIQPESEVDAASIIRTRLGVERRK